MCKKRCTNWLLADWKGHVFITRYLLFNQIVFFGLNVDDDYLLLSEYVPVALKQVFPGCIDLLIDGRDVSCLKDFLQLLLGGLSKAFGLSMELAEDVEEFCELIGLDEKEDDVPVIFVACCNSSFIPPQVFESVLDILKKRMSVMNINFLFDSEKPTVDLPFYKQDRLLHYVVSLPAPACLADELVYKSLATKWLHFDRALCEYLLQELFEREASFHFVTQCLSFVQVHRSPVELERNFLLSLYAIHFASRKILKQNKLLLEILESLLKGKIDKMMCNIIQAAPLQDRIAVLLDVVKVVPKDKGENLFDQCIEALKGGDTSCVDQVYCFLLDCDPCPQPTPDMTASLRRAFSPDPHLAIQTALKHPFLYLNTEQVNEYSPASLLYRIVCEQACHKPSIPKLFKQFVNLGQDRSLFVPALRTLQLCGQLGPCRAELVERLNPDDSLALSELIDDLFIREDP